MALANRIERAFELLQKLLPELSAALDNAENESETRFRVIDRVLCEVLGWPRENVKTEPPSDAGYLDYLLIGDAGRGLLVLEAKKVGHLGLSTAKKSRTVLQIDGPVMKPLRLGVDQALGYAAARGLPFAALSDGRTWAFFRASRTDGVPPSEGKAIVFPGLDSIAANFAEFYELLGFEPLIERLNVAHLNRAEGFVTTIAERQYAVLPPADARMLPRSTLAGDASLLFRQFFSRLTNDADREMLRECFAETAESRKHDVDLQKIVERLVNSAQAIESAEGAALAAEIRRTIDSRTSESILLVGNKGAGKSTFIDRFFELVLPAGMKEKCIVVRIDLGKHTGDVERLTPWILGELRDKLEGAVCTHNPPSDTDLQGIFWAEYQRWSSGPHKTLYETDKTQFKIKFGDHIERFRRENVEDYVRLLIARASSGLQKLPCVIFDNTDQFSPQTQDRVYQLAHALTEVAPILTIVPITDRTIWRMAKAGALQSYPAKTFYLPVPEAKQILSKRVAFVKLKLKAEPAAAKAYFSRKGFTVGIDNLQIFADAIERVFVETEYVSGLIGRLGNFNIRIMLELAQRVFLSPEIQIDEIVKSSFGGEAVTADKKRTHRALIKGEYDRFVESENSFILNLFWTNPERPATPLLSYHILWLLRHRMSRADDTSAEAKHWGVGELCNYLEPCGVDRQSVMDILKRLYDTRLIEAFDPTREVLAEGDQISIKECGVAHIDLLQETTIYVELMSLVTGLNNSGLRERFKSVSGTKNRQAYRTLVAEFSKYLRDLDDSRFRIPTASEYQALMEARRAFSSFTARAMEEMKKSSPANERSHPLQINSTPRNNNTRSARGRRRPNSR